MELCLPLLVMFKPGTCIKGTNILQGALKSLPFLKLPPEIRIMIYRLVLLMQNVMTDKPSASHTCRIPREGTNGFNSETGRVRVGTVRCDSWRTYTIGYQISILRANAQIYREARDIFHLENFWTVVRVNKAGFGKEMKDHHFPVLTGGDVWRQVRCPVLKVTVTFASLPAQKQSEALLLATVHHKELF